MTPGLLAVPVALVLLAGCGSDPADDLRADVAALTEAANDGDADGVRDRADALLTTVQAQREADQLDAQEADRLIALAQSVRTNADVVDAELLERRRVEAEAEAAKQQLEQARRQLEEERKKAEEAARRAAEDAGKGEGKGDKKEEDEEEKDDD